MHAFAEACDASKQNLLNVLQRHDQEVESLKKEVYELQLFRAGANRALAELKDQLALLSVTRAGPHGESPLSRGRPAGALPGMLPGEAGKRLSGSASPAGVARLSSGSGSLAQAPPVPPAPAPASLEGSGGAPASPDEAGASAGPATDAAAASADSKAGASLMRPEVDEDGARSAAAAGEAARARRAKAGYVLEVEIHEGRLSGRASDSERLSGRSERGEHSRRGFTPTARKAPVLPRGMAPPSGLEEKTRRSRHYSADTRLTANLPIEARQARRAAGGVSTSAVHFYTVLLVWRQQPAAAGGQAAGWAGGTGRAQGGRGQRPARPVRRPPSPAGRSSCRGPPQRGL
jgi:hypothetical protein